MSNVSKAMEYAAAFEREAMHEILDALGDLDHMNLIQIEGMVLNHRQQIKDIEAKLLELKSLVTPMMEFKRSGWVGLTGDEKLYSNTNYLGKSAEAWHVGVEWAEAKLKEKNTSPTVKKSLTVQWVGLTDDEMQTAYRKIDDWNACLAFINGKLREKNGG